MTRNVNHGAWLASLIVSAMCFSVATFADEEKLPTGDEVIEAALKHRPVGDFRIKGKLFRLQGIDGKKEIGAVELLVHNGGTETRTVARALEPAKFAGTTLLIIQPHETGARPQFYLASSGQKPVELTGERLKESFMGSDFSYEDLNLAFCLYWPKRKVVGAETVRGQTAYKLELFAPKDAASQYAWVVCWVDKKHHAILKTQAYDADGAQVRKFSVSALKKVVSEKGNGLWTVRALEILWRPPHQALPNAQKTRLEVTEEEYEIELPPNLFQPETFAETPSR